ncbi:jg5529 [Pararge aegeria aegeria]|uniref:Jg5529 protein n=1 Tax=Pararge aegeria aegeria TaxID=348720 RepID=A0A8S4SGY1_9NEOP|nr:jg5529 [Pararge aegeria aegeria]
MMQWIDMGLIRRLRVTQRAIERAMLGVSLRDQELSSSVENQSYRNSSKCREAKVTMGGAHTCPKMLERQPRTG